MLTYIGGTCGLPLMATAALEFQRAHDRALLDGFQVLFQWLVRQLGQFVG